MPRCGDGDGAAGRGAQVRRAVGLGSGPDAAGRRGRTARRRHPSGAMAGQLRLGPAPRVR